MTTQIEVYRETISANAPDAVEAFLHSMREFGFALVTDCYSPIELKLMKDALLEVESRFRPDDPSFVLQGPHMWAIWNLFDHSPALMRLSMSYRAMGFLWHQFGQDAHFCRSTLMKKNPAAAQNMVWHQDRPGAVDRDQPDSDSVGVRAGVPHRNLSLNTIEHHYLIARIHLEEQFADGGALLVVPGSNKLGVLKKEEWHQAAMEGRQVVVAAPAGSVLFAVPMTLHSSGPNSRNDPNNHRRVIHNEFRSASSTPCDGFNWYPWKNSVIIKQDRVEVLGTGNVEAPKLQPGVTKNVMVM